jgi:hypothetical protein
MIKRDRTEDHSAAKLQHQPVVSAFGRIGVPAWNRSSLNRLEGALCKILAKLRQEFGMTIA